MLGFVFYHGTKINSYRPLCGNIGREARRTLAPPRRSFCGTSRLVSVAQTFGPVISLLFSE